MFSCVDIRRASAAGVVLLLVVASAARAASIDASNLVYETPRIASGDQLVSHVINDCFGADTMVCLKGKVLNYLDTQLNINEEYGRSFESNKIDELIYDRAARVMTQSQFRVQLPAAVFDRAELSYAPDTGLDITPAAEEGRGHLLKKKVLLPILLLLKLKFKALLPIFVALIGVKAMKALILSKLAISVVLGFVIYQLIAGKKAAMAMPMTEQPVSAYGPPTSAASSSYDPSGWDSSSSGGPYARVWEPSTSSSSQSLAYSSYYPSSSSSSGSSSGGSSSLTSGSSTSGSSGSSSY